MPPPRPILALALGSLVLAGLGLRDWTIEAGRAADFANRALAAYDLALTAQGPATLALLPRPRIVFAHTSLSALSAREAGGPVLAEGGRLTLDIAPLDLLAGRAGLDGLGLSGGRLSDAPGAWAGPLARLSGRVRAGAAGHPVRLALTGVRLGADAVRDLDLDLAWPFWSAAAELRASLTWRGVPVRVALDRLRPADLAQARPSPFSAAVSWPGGSLAAVGTAGPPPEAGGLPVLTGRARAETGDLPGTLAWLGAAAPLGPLAGPLTLEGDFETRGRAMSWPSLHLALGSNGLEGAASLTLGTEAAPRLSVQATLAADTLNLAPLLGALVRLVEPDPVPLALAPLTRGDLDLRLSATAGRFGPVRIEDLAASVLVREAAVEVAVNRARVQGGTLKGRVTLTSAADPAETEIRAQGGVDRLDLGGLMSDLGAPRWVNGAAQGQFALEGAARDTAGLLARVSGRASLSIDGGSIAGLDLADVIHRNGAVAAGALARRNGRTGFERAFLTLRFSEGVGEITEAGLRGGGVAASLRGLVSLPEQRVDALADIAPRSPGDGARRIVFEVAGPWDAVTARVTQGEPAEPTLRGGEAGLPGPFKLPAALGLSAGDARAYAP